MSIQSFKRMQSRQWAFGSQFPELKQKRGALQLRYVYLCDLQLGIWSLRRHLENIWSAQDTLVPGQSVAVPETAKNPEMLATVSSPQTWNVAWGDMDTLITTLPCTCLQSLGARLGLCAVLNTENRFIHLSSTASENHKRFKCQGECQMSSYQKTGKWRDTGTEI